MAQPATLVVEVRPTNGTADGGGGFDPAVASPGTDFSQQNAVQVAYTDLAVGTPNTTVTSVAAAFTSADVGNTIAITTTGGGAAWTVGLYNIRSQAAGVATLDRSPAITASTAGVGNLGGARNGLSTGVTPIQGAGVLVAGNTVYIKNEAWNEAVAWAQAGATGAPIQIIGYNATRDDIKLGDGNANNPVNNRASAAGDGITTNVAQMEIRNINVTAAGDAGFAGGGAVAGIKHVNCKSYSNGGEGFEQASANAWSLLGCEVSLNGNSGLSSVGAALIQGCYIHDNTGRGYLGSSNGMSAYFSVFDSNSNHNIELTTATIRITNCTIYGSTGANTDGLLVTTPGEATVLNNIFASNARYGVNATDADSIYEDFNDFSANGTAPRNPATASAGGWGPATSDSTGAPGFTDAANGNFAIDTTLKALGFPGVFPGGLSTGYLDMGAVQREEAGAGGGMIVHPGMSGRCNA